MDGMTERSALDALRPEQMARSLPVRRHMRRSVAAHRDARTGEVNMTALAEATAAVFDLYGDDGSSIPEELFDVAFEVAEEVDGTG